jgi:hypothetical protein
MLFILIVYNLHNDYDFQPNNEIVLRNRNFNALYSITRFDW